MENNQLQKINRYKFDNVAVQMKKEVGSIKKGDEGAYEFELFVIEREIVKFYLKNRNINDLRVIEAIKICLLKIKGYFLGTIYNYSGFTEPVSIEFADRLIKTFDPFENEEIYSSCKTLYDFHSKEGLREYLEIPAKCFIRILESVELWTKEGGKQGYLDFISGQIGQAVDVNDEKVHFIVRVPKEKEGHFEKMFKKKLQE